MQNDEITIVPVNGWIGIYVNGALKLQNHPWRVPETEWIKLGMEFPGASIKKQYASGDWIEKVGRLPEQLQDVVFEATDA